MADIGQFFIGIFYGLINWLSIGYNLVIALGALAVALLYLIFGRRR
jgi:hypothetical protein